MLPTFYNLTANSNGGSFTFTAVNENSDNNDVQLVRRGSNDVSSTYFNSTINRIIAQRNATDQQRAKKALNDNINTNGIISKTMDGIIDRHNNNAGSPNWTRYRTAANQNPEGDLWPDGVVAAGSIDHSSAFERTMDRMLSLHNAHDREFQPPANEGGPNPIAVSSMDRIGDKYTYIPDTLSHDNDDSDPVEKRKYTKGAGIAKL